MSQSVASDARYAVGIDLGTTHSVLAYVEACRWSRKTQQKSVVMPIAQLTAPGSVEEREQLPSFVYCSHESELSIEDLALPWPIEPDSANAIVGALARELGEKTAIRLVSSAKSWLCYGAVDRHSDLLPFNAPDEVQKMSPFDASKRYLQHIVDAWHYRFPDAPLASQDVTLTIPASFDPAARELTAEAAKAVGFG